jgi:hypothetical protein
MWLEKRKKGQLTVFIVLAVFIVAGIGTYFLLKNRISIEKVPASLKPVEEYFLSCIEDYAGAGISLLGEQAGYIYLPAFEPGSEYMPSSNQLNFLGSPIPYWYYVSNNNFVKEQVPSKSEMEKQLEKYLEENLACDFSGFRERGFAVSLGKIEADAKILENKVGVELKADLDVGFDDQTYVFTKHKKEIGSKLGKFYDSALKIYNKEKQEAFLENYALDALYLYAPVTGVELSCSPKIWMKKKVDDVLKEALEENVIMLRKGGYSGKMKYFNVNVPSNEEVQFLYSKDWPTKIEVQPEKQGLLLSEPVGNQPGLGILGFCYVPYHFVYNLVYPVLIQIYDSQEIFQFPVVVVINGNKPREALHGVYVGEKEPELCKYKNTEIKVYTYNTNLEPVEADISFKCFNEKCRIGKTKVEGEDALLVEKFPQCINGFVLAKADGYEEGKEMISTNKEGEASIILDKLYNISINLKINDRETDDLAVISFESEDTSVTGAWPEQKSLSLSEGSYNISVFIYRNSSIYLQETKMQKCVEMPQPGLLGVLGFNTEKCFDLTIPSQTLSNVVVGGGKAQQYITETELQKGKVEILAESLPLPISLEQLQKNYELLEAKKVYLEFK